MENLEQNEPIPPSINPQELLEPNGLIVTDEKLAEQGAYAEDGTRRLQNICNFDVSDEKSKEVERNTTADAAMIVEVGRRAEALVPNASENIRTQVREAAESYFQTILEKRTNEKQAKNDEEALELLAKIQSGQNVSDIFDVEEPINNPPLENNETL